MTRDTQDEPIMEGSDDATDNGKLHGLVEQVEQDHGAEGAASMADHLRERLEETGVEKESPGDLED